MIKITRSLTNSAYDQVELSPNEQGAIPVITLRQAQVIARNVLKGKPYLIASPIFNLSRQEIAEIHINANFILRS